MEFIRSRFDSFLNAANGIFTTLGTQVNFMLEVFGAIFLVFLGMALSIEVWQWVALLGSLGILLAAELFNTAIEHVVDLISPEYHDLAEKAKDAAAGAVLVAAGVCVLVAAFIFLPIVEMVLML